MSTTDLKFNKAVHEATNLSVKPSNENMLLLYGHYKQATVGDINIEKPSFINFKAVEKWNAWNKMKYLSQHDSKVNYIKLVSMLKSA